MNGETEGSLEGFVFDPAVCRRAFDHYDKDKSGYLDAKEIMKLADVSDKWAQTDLWSSPENWMIYLFGAETLGHDFPARAKAIGGK